jgi:4-hydroxy-2-oxoheptanedioate aldolase
MQTLRQLWAAGHDTFGGWLSIPSSVSAEAAARVGLDYVCIDTQHGAVDYQTSVAMLQAIELGGSRPVVRVPWNEPGIIGKMLDAGAHGVIIPMVNSRDEAEAAVGACRYAPAGSRSYGPTLAVMRHTPYHGWAIDHVAAIPMIETAQALANIDDILATPGIDAIYVGPADLSLSLGLPPGNNDDRSEFTEALLAIVAACHRHGIVPGIHASGALAARRREQGFRMITIASDMLAVRDGMAAELQAARRGPGTSSSTSGPYG